MLVPLAGIPFKDKDQGMDEPQPESQSPDEFFLTAVLFEMALGLIALGLGWWIGPDPREMIPPFDPDAVGPIVSGVLWGLLATVPILIFMEIVRRIPCEAVRKLERLSDEGMMQTLLSLHPLEMIAISLCAGIGEELLFRGWLMYGVADTYQWLAGFSSLGDHPAATAVGLTVALVLSSVAFGLVHPITKLYIVLAAVMGLYLGALVIGTGNLLIPITAHAAYDAVQMLMAAREDRRKTTQVETP